MPSKPALLSNLKFYPATPKHWKELVNLFGPHGACGGCWCMLWRLPRAQWQQQLGEKNRKALKKIVDSGEIPGILAYANGKPIGWCAVAPRETFQLLDRSRIIGRVDEKPVWSVVCFFVAKPFRQKGIGVAMLKSAAEYARKKGAKIVEGYPIEPKKGKFPDVFANTGLASAFRQAGFVETLRRSETRPIMRYYISNK
ncbi:MAG: GNAT family N-acetyltransferase [candidate division Zixibacteria bacterium]|nr:GNAT family N-acetyltransferase [candidate division Zixibacteria bacterium]